MKIMYDSFDLLGLSQL